LEHFVFFDAEIKLMIQKQLCTLKNYLLLCSFCFVIFSNCQNEVCNCTTDISMRKSNDSICTAVNNRWRKTELWENFDEPYLDSIRYQAYRVSLYHPLENFTKIIRIEEIENKYKLTIKTYCDSYSFSIKKNSIPSENITRPLSKEEWSKITSKINENCFWTMDLRMNRSQDCLDCSGVFFIEGNNPKIKCSNLSPYHIYSSISARDSLTDYKYWQFCDMILDLGQ
jgi:hypothetical protein